MEIERFFNEEYVYFANYRTTQRLPNYDGLIETQRKVIYTFLELNVINKERTVTLTSDVMKFTHYNHGDKSVSGVINNLAASWCNNLPLISEDGSFGYRSNRRAADPRYTQTRMKNYLKVLFNPIDNENFIENQYDGDGHKIEPLTLIPILPLLLINGNIQIGVGFALKVLPRDPHVIIKLLKEILEGKTKTIPFTIPPSYNGFKGLIEQAEPDNPNSWKFTGVFKKGKSNTIIVEEIPMKFDRDKYLSILNKLKESEKIISYKENINKNTFYIEIKVDSKLYNSKDETIIKVLNLTNQESEFINIINETGEIKTEFSSIGEYLYHFIKWRLSIYSKRKDFLITDFKKNIDRANEIIRFIKQVNNNEINIHKQNKKSIEEQIIKNKYIKIDNSYNYLLNLKIYDLTEEEIDSYLKDLEKLNYELKKLEDTTVAQMWLADIEKLEKLLKK
jgi:DNA topoisomerase-2